MEGFSLDIYECASNSCVSTPPVSIWSMDIDVCVQRATRVTTRKMAS